MSIYRDLLIKALEAHGQVRQNLRSRQTTAAIGRAVGGFAEPFDEIARAIDARRSGRHSGDFSSAVLKSTRSLTAQLDVLAAVLGRAEDADRAAVRGIVVQPGPSIEIMKALREADRALLARATQIVGIAGEDSKKADGDAPAMGFEELAAAWKRETVNESSSQRMAAHPAYRKIVAMGEKAVPLVLAEMRERPDYWFAALREITNADPVPAEARGDLSRMTQAWLDWGRENGYRLEIGQ
ncbi:MAG: hypothetical protein ACREHE_10350 [Rhizomicrobium sp.]